MSLRHHTVKKFFIFNSSPPHHTIGPNRSYPIHTSGAQRTCSGLNLLPLPHPSRASLEHMNPISIVLHIAKHLCEWYSHVTTPLDEGGQKARRDGTAIDCRRAKRDQKVPKGSIQGNRELRRQQIPIHMFPNEAVLPEPMGMSAMHTRHEYRLDAFFGHRHLPRRRELSAQRFSASSCCRTRTG